MIDVHMLTLPTDRPDWKKRMVESLPDWVTLHEIPGVVGPIGPQRLAAFRLGEHPYVSFVDPDDWTETAAWQRALDELKALEPIGAKGVVTREIKYEVSAGGRTKPLGFTPYKHHFVIATREFIEEREALFRFDVYEKDIFASPDIKQLGFVGYHWRRYSSAGYAERQRRTWRNNK